MAGQFLSAVLLAAVLAACGAQTSGSSPPPPAHQVAESAAPSPTPTPYQRRNFSAAEVAVLDEGLPKKVRDVLEQASEIEAFSISSSPKAVVIADAAVKSELLDAFYAGVVEPAHMAGCFRPHHGIRAKQGGDEVEIKICFECKNFRGDSRREGRFSGRVGTSPEVTFNRVLELPIGAQRGSR